MSTAADRDSNRGSAPVYVRTLHPKSYGAPLVDKAALWRARIISIMLYPKIDTTFVEGR
jgi:hypothetical protein